jgi:O-acetyl-ADP-ribose deacetylase (regulator of RNase III)
MSRTPGTPVRPDPVQVTVGSTRLELVEGDLTELAADAIVNAANRELQLGAGVAGAIRSKGGPAIQEECDRLGPIQVGEAVLTGAGELAARHVIHAVGPRQGEGDEEEKLASATRQALLIAEEQGLGWVALPAISTGVFGFPLDRCAAIMLGTAIAFLLPGSHLDRVTFCLWGNGAFSAFADELARHGLGGTTLRPTGGAGGEGGGG